MPGLLVGTGLASEQLLEVNRIPDPQDRGVRARDAEEPIMIKTFATAVAALGALAFTPSLAHAQFYGQSGPSDQFTGGLVGGTLGSVVGRSIAGSGNRTEGAIIGGIVGGIAGTAVGNSRSNRGYRSYSQPTYYSSPSYYSQPTYYRPPVRHYSPPVRHYSPPVRHYAPPVRYSQPTYYSQPRYHGGSRSSNGRVVGGLVGGTAGSVIGRSIAGSGNRTEGAIIGGIVGGIAGTAIGNRTDRRSYGSYGYSQPSYHSAPRRTYSYGSTHHGGFRSIGHSTQANCPFGTRPSRDSFTGSTVCVVN